MTTAFVILIGHQKVIYGTTSFPMQLKQPNTDWTLTKNQNSSIKSCNSINMDGTLMRKAMHADPENYVTSMAPGQYWTWGTNMKGNKDYKTSPADYKTSPADYKTSPADYKTSPADYKMSPADYKTSPADYKTSPADYKTSPADYKTSPADFKSSPSAAGGAPHSWTPRCTPPPQQQQPALPPRPPPDYQHNVYIPGTPSGFCTLRPVVQRSELDVRNSFSTFGKKKRLQMSPQGEAAIINNDLYND